MRLLLRLRCTLAGHPMTISNIESINGQLYAVSETCACGKREGPSFPGALFKEQRDAYADYSAEWKDIF
jgi:hypothetical protein